MAIKAVRADDDLMITSKDGIVIRMAVEEISVLGRATQGVRVIKIQDEDEIADVAVVRREEDSDEEASGNDDGEVSDDGQEEE